MLPTTRIMLGRDMRFWTLTPVSFHISVIGNHRISRAIAIERSINP